MSKSNTSKYKDLLLVEQLIGPNRTDTDIVIALAGTAVVGSIIVYRNREGLSTIGLVQKATFLGDEDEDVIIEILRGSKVVCRAIEVYRLWWKEDEDNGTVS